MDEITIRQAVCADAEEIWELLRIEKELWSIEKILVNIENFFVIIKKKSIISILHGTFNPGMEKINWVVVHPMYPEKAVCLSMIFGFWGVMCRKPVNDAAFKVVSKAVIKNRYKNGNINIFTNNKAEGVSNEISSEQGIGVSHLSAVGGADKVFSFKRIFATGHKSTDS